MGVLPSVWSAGVQAQSFASLYNLSEAFCCVIPSFLCEFYRETERIRKNLCSESRLKRWRTGGQRDLEKKNRCGPLMMGEGLLLPDRKLEMFLRRLWRKARSPAVLRQ